MREAGLVHPVTILRARSAAPWAVGPASRLRRRYADAPAAALLTDLGAGEWSPLRSRAHTPFFMRSRGLRHLCEINWIFCTFLPARGGGASRAASPNPFCAW